MDLGFEPRMFLMTKSHPICSSQMSGRFTDKTRLRPRLKPINSRPCGPPHVKKVSFRVYWENSSLFVHLKNDSFLTELFNRF